MLVSRRSIWTKIVNTGVMKLVLCLGSGDTAPIGLLDIGASTRGGGGLLGGNWDGSNVMGCIC